MTINENQKKIIAELRKNSRTKITDIAKKHDVAVSTLHDALKSLSKRNVIEFKSLIDFKKIGFQHQAMLALRTNHDSRDELKLYLEESKNVNSLYMVDSGYDYFVQAVFKDQKEFHEFLDEIESKNLANEMIIFNVLDVIHRENFMTNEDHFC
jgi:DNA-binding Lrp family transcriptional regulator